MLTRYHLNRFLLMLGTIVSALIFWFAGRVFRIPQFAGYDVSILRQPSWIVALLVLMTVVCVSTIICTLIAGSVRSDAGLFCTALGMIALAMRGGSVRYTLFDASHTVFYAMAIEVVLLFAMLWLGWIIVARMRAMGLTRQDDEDYRPDDLPRDQKILATAVQACATATVVLILCRNDSKVQTLAAVGVASFAGSLLAILSAPTRRSVWFWPGPMFVAILGYAWASFSPEKLPIGQTGGYFAALARPLPLHYASAGIAGAMLGYWFGRSWTRETLEENSDEPIKPAPPPSSTVPSV